MDHLPVGQESHLLKGKGAYAALRSKNTALAWSQSWSRAIALLGRLDQWHN